jgi:hypothetical protein
MREKLMVGIGGELADEGSQRIEEIWEKDRRKSLRKFDQLLEVELGMFGLH